MLIMDRRRYRYSTVDEALDKIRLLQHTCERMPELYGYRSRDIGRYRRKLVALASSLSVVFLQYDLVCEAYRLLKLAATTDARLESNLLHARTDYTGRLVTYSCLAALFDKYV